MNKDTLLAHIYGFEAGRRLYSPPALVPIFTNFSFAQHIGIWRLRGNDVYVSYAPEDGCGVEIARNDDQFRRRLAYWIADLDMDNAENNVVGISNSLELSEYEMREIFAQAGQGLPLFGDVAGSPAEAARKNYDGNWSSPSGLGCICGLETTRRGPSLRDAILRISDGDVEGAWFEINTPGWRGFEASEVFKAFLSLSGFEAEKKCIYDWVSENGEPTGETNVW